MRRFGRVRDHIDISNMRLTNGFIQWLAKEHQIRASEDSYPVSKDLITRMANEYSKATLKPAFEVKAPGGVAREEFVDTWNQHISNLVRLKWHLPRHQHERLDEIISELSTMVTDAAAEKYG